MLDICVTIPYSLSAIEQIQLTSILEDIGIQILQTESLKLRLDLNKISLTELLNLSFPVLSFTYIISKAVKLLIIASSGMNSIVSSLAVLYSVSGIGVGSLVANCSNLLSKYRYIKESIYSLRGVNMKSCISIASSMQVCNSILV